MREDLYSNDIDGAGYHERCQTEPPEPMTLAEAEADERYYQPLIGRLPANVPDDLPF